MLKFGGGFALGFVAGFAALFILMLVYGDFGAPADDPVAVTVAAAPAAMNTEVPTPASPPTALPATDAPAPTDVPPTATPIPTATATAIPETVAYLGDTATQAGYSLVAFAVQDPVLTPGIFYEAQPGMRLIAVEFAVGNVSAETFSSNVLNTVLTDSDGRLYGAENGGIDNQMELLDVSPGEVVRGWAGFVIPDNATPAKLKYGFDYGRHYIQVELKQR